MGAKVEPEGATKQGMQVGQQKNEGAYGGKREENKAMASGMNNNVGSKNQPYRNDAYNSNKRGSDLKKAGQQMFNK